VQLRLGGEEGRSSQRRTPQLSVQDWTLQSHEIREWRHESANWRRVFAV